MHKYILAAFAAITLLAPAVAGAQALPSYAQPPAPSYASGEENIHGRIVSFDGRYALTVRDERGYVDSVQLHQGTIINPTGLTLEPGMVVSVLGYNAGSFIAANEIDTPYTLTYGVPYWAGHPYSYYGPSVSLNLFFGSPGWWHGSYFHGGYHYRGGARVYAAPFRPVYSGGSFRGPAYHASPERGEAACPARRPSRTGGVPSRAAASTAVAPSIAAATTDDHRMATTVAATTTAGGGDHGH